jgi:hypothetical protein
VSAIAFMQREIQESAYRYPAGDRGQGAHRGGRQ